MEDLLSFSSEEKYTFQVPSAMIYLREKEIMPTQRHHRTIFIWLANSPISDVIRILDDSILWCEQAWIRNFSRTNLGE